MTILWHAKTLISEYSNLLGIYFFFTTMYPYQQTNTQNNKLSCNFFVILDCKTRDFNTLYLNRIIFYNKCILNIILGMIDQIN